MIPSALPLAILTAASWLVPAAGRPEWLREWRSELWYVPRAAAVGFSLGAFRDALWLRRQDPAPRPSIALLFESPLHCLLFLAVVGAAGVVLAIGLPVPPRLAPFWRLTLVDLWRLAVGHTAVFLPVTRLVMGGGHHEPAFLPWRGRLRCAGLLVLKLLLIQPLVLSTLLILLRIGSPLGPLGIGACWILAFRWALLDQRRRCPVCLRLLTQPVRIGSPSQTFLDWYGAESVCARGHGILQVPETSTSYAGSHRWLRLDHSWSGLFPAAGAPHP